MKLQTSIALRKDGTVTLAGLDGKDYVFKPDESGDVVCDVEDAETLAHALQTENFWPADEEAYSEAEALLRQAAAKKAEEDGDDLDDEDDDEVIDPNAMLVEANTPPAVAPGAPAKKARAKKTTAK
jgi:transcriptional/translational regulatory protein YebC/TACO1